MGLAFHNYHQAENRFPAAAISDPQGKPLLSWRVAILPYIGEEGMALYGQFKLDEPWDSPTNRALIPRMPLVYRCPSDNQLNSNSTRYQAIVGPGTLFDGTVGASINTITDGTSNTILVVEAKDPVEWTKPDDVDLGSLTTDLGGNHPGIINAVFADGSVKGIKAKTSAAVLKGLCTKNAGEVIAADSY